MYFCTVAQWYCGTAILWYSASVVLCYCDALAGSFELSWVWYCLIVVLWYFGLKGAVVVQPTNWPGKRSMGAVLELPVIFYLPYKILELKPGLLVLNGAQLFSANSQIAKKSLPFFILQFVVFRTDVPISKNLFWYLLIFWGYISFPSFLFSPCYIGFRTRLVSFVKKVIFRMIWHKVSINQPPLSAPAWHWHW